MTQEFKERYRWARRAVIARRYARMNTQQREAVLATEGPLLVLPAPASTRRGPSVASTASRCCVFIRA